MPTRRQKRKSYLRKKFGNPWDELSSSKTSSNRHSSKKTSSNRHSSKKTSSKQGIWRTVSSKK